MLLALHLRHFHILSAFGTLSSVSRIHICRLYMRTSESIWNSYTTRHAIGTLDFYAVSA